MCLIFLQSTGKKCLFTIATDGNFQTTKKHLDPDYKFNNLPFLVTVMEHM